MNRRFFLFMSAIGLATAAPHVQAEDKKKGGGKGYTQFPTISVFTDANRSRHGTLSVDVGLYSDNPKMVAQIQLYMPRLQDAYVGILQAYAGNLTRTSLVDTDYIATQLQAATDRVLGTKGAKLLLGSILLN